jgi:hypothetical protein
MGLFDGYNPQDFADRGGLLGRLLSLRPDLAQDQPGEYQQAQAETAQAPGQQPSGTSTSSPLASAIGGALDDFYRQTILQPIKDIPGYVNDAINDPGYFTHAVGPSLAGLGPMASQLPAAVRGAMGAFGLAARPNSDSVGNANISPAGSPVNGSLRTVQSVPAPPISGPSPSLGSPVGSGMLPALAAAAALASRKSSELLGGQPQPIAPVFPQPTPMPSEDDLQQAFGPAWKQLQSFFDNTGLGHGALILNNQKEGPPADGPPLPEDLIGSNPRQTGNRSNTDMPGINPTPEELFDKLTGGRSETLPDGTRKGPNNIRLRPDVGEGPRLDIPANGKKPHETIHFPGSKP